MREMILLCLMLTLISSIGMSQRNCGSMDHLQLEMEKDPDRINRLNQIENHTLQWIKTHKGDDTRAVITIPVVFHVVYRTSTENISAAQVQSQIDVLNEDFRRLNSDADNTWSQAADAEIEFCLASVDPSGNSTDGITRTSTSVNGFGTNDAVKSASSGGKAAWPASDYLNFWVCNIGGGILGYAQFPGGAAATDGVVGDYRYTGTNGTATSPFDLGRTATHEVGHWLNLRHIWGDGPCGSDDFVSDTPTSDDANYGCATGHVSCSSTDMVQNYTDYSDDACMNLFTQGQKSRMQALFGGGGSKASLLSSNGCGSGNPPVTCTQNEVTISITFDNYPEETSWTLKNDAGTTVASGGTYGSQADGSTLVIEECLANGCYDFTISDTYGDGICCSYGNGSYNVSNSGQTLASGGSFSSSETTNICVGGASGPTCTDGIQNGSETGVDCGGPDCAACPTCNDGVQNGNETGVDCGGPDCAACPTCSDGVQNGNETGVDCGGPDCSACSTGGPTELLASYFESGWDGWTDGGSDCYRYNGSRSWEGSKSIRIRDNSGSVSAMTSPYLNMASYSSVEVSFYFYPNSMENGEDFWLRYNDGSGWQTVASWASGSSFSNNNFYTATVTLSSANYNLVNNGRFRFQCDASANADRVYIDEVIITGNGSGSRLSGESTSDISLVSGKTMLSDLDDLGYEVFPNPATSSLSIRTEDNINEIKIISLTGQLIRTQTIQSDHVTLDIAELKTGLYLLSIETDEEVLTQKFVKQ